MEQVNGIGGAFVPARDPIRLGRWYVDHLGAQALPESDGLTLFAATPGMPVPDGWSLSFQVADLDAMAAQLRAAGATVETDPVTRPEGRFASLRDPEDNLIQLYEPAAVQRVISAAPDAVRVVEDEPVEPTARRASWRRWAPWLPLVIAGALALALVVSRQEDTTAQPPPQPAPSRATTTPPDDPVTVTDVGDRILGVRTGWELIGHGPDAVVRIEFAEGRITTTDVHELGSSDTSSLIAGPDWVIVQPLDFAPGGYFVPDGRPARELAGALGGRGPLVPGPRPDQVWVDGGQIAGGTRVLFLHTASGDRVGPVIRIPDTMPGQITSDGAGHVLASGPGGTYVARPSGLSKLTSGQVDAIGPEHLLVTECDDQARCSRVVVSRGTGQRRTLTDVTTTTWPRGEIAPDGSIAAVVRDVGGRPLLSLIDLRSGEESTLGVSVRVGFLQSGLVFSPDSRWLFATAASGALVAIDTESYRTHPLDFSLPSITQLTIRPAS